MTRILGIDPGSRTTGYGIIDHSANVSVYVASGCIRVQGTIFPQRLKQIYSGIDTVVGKYRPEEAAIERVFMHRNADSALKLGQARGAALCAALIHELAVYEYAAREIKQALVGKGSADKFQVRYMVKLLLGVEGQLQLDASDALAAALCHAHHQQTQGRMRLQGAVPQ